MGTFDITAHMGVSRETLERFEMLWEMHRDSPLNLTSIRDRDEFFLKHYLDSALIFKEDTIPAGSAWKTLRGMGSVADIGSGGGFPGLVIAMLFPDARVSLIESIGKKCRFLEDAARELSLANVEVVNARAEEVTGRNFDLITARGVSKVAQVLKWTWSLSHAETVWLMYKGSRLDEELQQASPIIKKRKLQVEHVRIESPFTRSYCLFRRHRS